MSELDLVGGVSSDTPQAVFGRLKEGINLSSYGLARARIHLNSLLEDEQWRELGYSDVNTFIKELELAQYRWPIDARREIERDMHDAGATQRSIAEALGVSHKTVWNDLRPDEEVATEEDEQVTDQQEQESEEPDDSQISHSDEPDTEDESDDQEPVEPVEDESDEEEVSFEVIEEDQSEATEDRKHWSVAEWQELPAEERQLIIAEPPWTNTVFNQVNENIDWAKWSWNPITGCLHNCPYCYARDIANRFYEQKFEPTFLPNRLHAPQNTALPDAAAHNVGWRNVFVCSMADLFGKWVPQDWIDAVFDQVKNQPQWNFLFLTKFPIRLSEIEWPDNAWCGTTVDEQWRVKNAEKAFAKVQAGIKWLSCEPLREDLTFESLEMFDWVVIGGQSASTGEPAFQPPWEWVAHLVLQAKEAGCKIYMKPNLYPLKEYPQEAVNRNV